MLPATDPVMPSLAKLIATATALLALLASASASLDYTKKSSGLKYDRVHLVDYMVTGGVQQFLFRGNFPANATHFQYDLLKEYMRARAQEQGIKFPEDEAYIVDVSLNNAVDTDPLEADFFKDPANADKGMLFEWPIGTSSVFRPRDVKDVAERERSAMETVWATDKFPDRVALVNRLMSTGTGTPRQRPLAVYVHCSAGCDRTGAFIGAYRMEYGRRNTTIGEIFKSNVAECGRVPNYFGVASTEWYCVRNELTSGRDLGGCLEIAKCVPFGDCKELA